MLIFKVSLKAEYIHKNLSKITYKFNITTMKMELVISMGNRDPYFYLRYSCKCITFFTHIYSLVLKLSLIECTTHPSSTTIPLYFNSSALQVFPACIYKTGFCRVFVFYAFSVFILD